MNQPGVVMVVDDDRELRESVCEFLEEDGFQAISMNDARAALAHLKQLEQKPDVILLDLELPGMTGWEFRSAQLQDPSLAAVPVVVITGSSNLADISANEVIRKPLRLESISAVLRRHQASHRQAAPQRRRRDDRVDIDRLFLGGGEMGQLMRAKDWGATALGCVTNWPQSLRTTVSLCLASNFPFCIAWGSQHTMIYNDGYLPVCGDKHPLSLGQDFAECWRSAWPVIGEAFGRALAGETSYLENQRMFLDRNGYLEETFFTLSFSPVRDETGAVGGVLNPCTETTANVLGERRNRALRDLNAKTGHAKSVEECLRLAAQILAHHQLDLPMVLFYLVENDGSLRLVSTSGLDRGTLASPARVPVGEGRGRRRWPFDEVRTARQLVLVDDIVDRFGELRCGPYAQSPKQAVVLPITPAGAEEPTVVVVAGVSPRLHINEAYRVFYDLFAASITAAVSNADAYQRERKRAEALTEVDRVKTAFFSNVSHEFRTPLTLILGPAEELLANASSELKPLQRMQLETLRRNGLRLQKLVNALLDFSRVEAGRVQATYEPVDLAQLTRELASAFCSTIERAGLTFTIDCAPLDELVFVDRDQWEKIVFNLLSNAFKFTLEGGITISLKASNGSVALKVKDTGVGIPSEELPRLFERFHRVPLAQARTQEGSGIGLAMVLELARLHGGSVKAESQLGVGSTFTVTVPKGSAHLPKERVRGAGPARAAFINAAPYVEEALRWLPDQPAEAAQERLRDNSDVEQPTKRRQRVLLADDNADMRNYVRRLLEPSFSVQAVENGAKALAAARASPPDLIVTDVMMPGIDGFTLLRELRDDERTREVPVLMLSARADEEALVDSLKAGAEDYLTKPFSARELLARVNVQLELGRLRDELKAQRDHLYDLFMAAPVAIGVVRGPDYVFEMANGTLIKQLGAHKLLGRRVKDALPRLEKPFLKLLERVRSTGKTYSGTEVASNEPQPDGTVLTRYWNFAIAALPSAGGVIERVMVVANDVSEQVSARHKAEAVAAELKVVVKTRDESIGLLREAQKEREQLLVGIEEARQRLYELFMQAPMAICVLRGPNLVFEMANETYVRGVHGDIFEKPMLEALPELEGQGVDALLNQVRETGRPYSGTEQKVRLNRDGVLRDTFWSFTYAPLRSPNGDIDRVVAFSYEVTEQVHARETLEQALRINEIFSGILAHDLRNPLGATMAAAEVLMRRLDGQGERVSKPLNRILASGERMARMIDQLLDLTRIRMSGGLEIFVSATDLGELSAQVVGELEATHPERHIKRIAEGNLLGTWDADRLLQVVSNLVANALQHSSSEVVVALDGNDTERVRLWVHNRGTIAAERLPHLFAGITSGQRPKERGKGLGLGLFITQQIVVAHGGLIEVESTETAGTTFRVELPREAAANAIMRATTRTS